MWFVMVVIFVGRQSINSYSPMEDLAQAMEGSDITDEHPLSSDGFFLTTRFDWKMLG
jgi:hypothetical protein